MLIIKLKDFDENSRVYNLKVINYKVFVSETHLRTTYMLLNCDDPLVIGALHIPRPLLIIIRTITLLLSTKYHFNFIKCSKKDGF